MQVLVGEHVGFCFGVKRGLALVERMLETGKGSYCSLGPLIHNDHVIQLLGEKGVRIVSSLDEVGLETLIVRLHGIGPSLKEEIARRGLEVLDATCPFVTRVHRLARSLRDAGYTVVVVGDSDHAEVQSILDWAGEGAIVISSGQEAAQLPALERVGVVAQTTQAAELFDEVVRTLRKRVADLKVHRTICQATVQRQRDARKLAKLADLVVVVGGADSANTRRLVETVRGAGARAYHVQGPEDVDPSWFHGVKVAGVTAGTSTPDGVIKAIVDKVSSLAPVGEADREEAGEESIDAVDYARGIGQLRPGQVVRGTVVQVGERHVLVDVGSKAEGIISYQELNLTGSQVPADVVREGDQIDVWILSAEDPEGRPKLSKKRADEEKAWRWLSQAYEAGSRVEGRVVGPTKGGLVVDVGVRAFLPASHVGFGYVRDLKRFAGKKMDLRVIEFSRARKKVVVSRRVALEEDRERRRAEALERIAAGEIRRGIVKKVADYGAFVDLGGIDGLVHVSELSWNRVGHPSQVVQEGETVEVMVLDVDRESGRISLGRRQVLPDPWNGLGSRYRVGEVVKGKVIQVTDFGAFVQVEPGVEGLVHLSQLSLERVESADKAVKPGDEVLAKIIKLDEKRRRLSLSVRAAERDREREEMRRYMARQGEGAVKLGELVGDLLSGPAGLPGKRGEEDA